MNAHAAVLRLRSDPAFRDLARDAYFDGDLEGCGARFAASGEFAEVRRLLGDRAHGSVLDLGAGNGIASFAFAKAGARRVVALEPDPSDLIGSAAAIRLTAGLPVEVVTEVAERLPLCDGEFDVVYARQVLHHLRPLEPPLREVARVLKPGGLFVATREHVANDESQLAAFLREHPVHRLTGGEHAYTLDEYTGAIEAAGLDLVQVLGPYDSVINSFPAFPDEESLARRRARLIRKHLGPWAIVLQHIPACRAAAARKLGQNEPGRLYSFVSRRPAAARGK